MAYTEIKKRNGNSYSYRVLSLREGGRVCKKRIYLGKNLSKEKLRIKQDEADKELHSLKRERKGDFYKIEKKLKFILREKGIKKAGIFGSYARGEQKKNSDIDILVELPKKYKGYKFYELVEDISKELNKKVDILTYKGINEKIKNQILREEIKIL
jgi:uncharacterized protein